MSILPDNVNKYLSKTLLSKWVIDWEKKNGIKNAIVIPALAELENIKSLLASLSENDPEFFNESLFIFVINHTTSALPEFKENNLSSIKLLKNIIHKETGHELISMINNSGLQIGFIDASSPGKELDEEDGGVGLARKIGFDLALGILDYSGEDKNILISLDADCTVDKNYLTSIVRAFNRNNLSAAVINYNHKIDVGDSNTEAIICYEILLRYYVLGLRYTESPFAFHTIGSAIACDYISYIRAGGMNKKKAGEDFYFLQKLAKLYNITSIYSTTVYPSSRNEVRTPFGTAKRMDDFHSQTTQNYLLYNPLSFVVLKEWLNLFNSDSALHTDGLMIEAEKISKQLFEFLISKKFPEQWNKILSNCKNEQQISYQRKNWFDAFKTLKLIHHLRDNAFPQVNMFTAVNELFFMMNEPEIKLNKDVEIPEIEVQKEFLLKLRELQKKYTKYKIEE